MNVFIILVCDDTIKKKMYLFLLKKSFYTRNKNLEEKNSLKKLDPPYHGIGAAIRLGR